MTREEAQRRLMSANCSIAAAVGMIRGQMEIIERYLEELRWMNSFGPIVDPSLFNDAERRAAEQLMTPVYVAARDLVRAHEAQRDKLRSMETASR